MRATRRTLFATHSVMLERAVSTRETWWGYDTLQVDDPDGHELFFPMED
jgi:hypothetical protein